MTVRRPTVEMVSSSHPMKHEPEGSMMTGMSSVMGHEEFSLGEHVMVTVIVIQEVFSVSISMPA